jgi:outer membrane protein
MVTLASGLALSATAQTPPSAPAHSAATPSAGTPDAATNIAVILFQTAVTQTNEFQRDFTDLQTKFDPQRQQIKSLSDEIATLEKQLQTQGDKLSDAERARLGRTIDEKQKQAKRMQDDAQSDYQQQIQEMFATVAGKVGDVMVAYAKQKGFTMVLDETENPNQQQPPLVLYAVPSIEITKAVIDTYNTKSGIPAPPQQPPSAPEPQAAPRAAPKPPAAPTH